MPIDEITARATEAVPLLYKNRGVMGAELTETSRVSHIATAVGLQIMRHATWYVWREKFCRFVNMLWKKSDAK